MPSLDFKGKQFIYAHHLSVPHCPLEIDSQKSLNAKGIDDNLIIHGDNLVVLKSLLPRYGGRVDCVYIDPIYNTGNENWIYNDNLNSPLMQEWYNHQNPIDGEDLERHDKWLCMMWPRLQVLKELLSDSGFIFVSIDDNEHHRLRCIMDEIFGEENFVASFLWKKKGTSTNVKGTSVSAITDYQLCYRKSYLGTIAPRIKLRTTRKYPHKDNQGNYRLTVIEKKNTGSYSRHTMQYQILGRHPRKGKRWQIGEETARQLEKEERLIVDERGLIKRKIYDFEDWDTKSAHPTILPDTCGSSDSANRALINILGNTAFENPKPPELIEHLISLTCDKNSLVLDSFAGSGTTAQSVLSLNSRDGGKRQFILIELEPFANDITAERVRRVITGVPNSGDERLEKGLGGSFAFCTLGAPIDLDSMLSGDKLPSYAELATYLLHTASGLSTNQLIEPKNDDGLYYENESQAFHLLYKQDLNWLRSNEATLSAEMAERISRRNKQVVVFAANKYVGQRFLTDLNIVFCHLPYELHQSHHE